MSQHRHALPQLTGGAFLIDGGIETPSSATSSKVRRGGPTRIHEGLISMRH